MVSYQNHRAYLLRPSGIEPPHMAPEAIALSTELQAHLGVPKDTLIYYTILPKLARGNLIYLRTNSDFPLISIG